MSYSFLAIIAGVFVALYFIQGKLIFLPQKISAGQAEITRKYRGVEELTIRTPDNKALKGWLVKSNPKGRSPLIIYYGGNAEEISYMIYEASRFKNWSLLLMNYRGYGLSEGSPGEKELCDDAVLIYDTVLKRPDIDSSNVVVFGRSLGTGVAVYTARNRRVDGVILATPFDSITNVARKKLFYLPLNILLRHKFDSFSRAPHIKAPLLALIAEDDAIIGPGHGERLVAGWGGKTITRSIRNTGHNTIDQKEEYWTDISAFLDQINN
jgi:hypothetical protein